MKQALTVDETSGLENIVVLSAAVIVGQLLHVLIRATFVDFQQSFGDVLFKGRSQHSISNVYIGTIMTHVMVPIEQHQESGASGRK